MNNISNLQAAYDAMLPNEYNEYEFEHTLTLSDGSELIDVVGTFFISDSPRDNGEWIVDSDDQVLIDLFLMEIKQYDFKLSDFR